MGSVSQLFEATVEAKSCAKCGRRFERPGRLSATQWENRLFCSRRCGAMKRRVGDTDILSMYAAGRSSVEISDVVGVSDVQVRRIIKEHGGEIRSPSEFHLLSHAKPETRARLSAAKKGIPCPEHVKAALRARTGRKNHSWISGITISAQGYLAFTSSPGNGEHAGRLLHQIIAEHKIGRALRAGEHVHHVDFNKLNNSPDNLEVMSAEDHARLHADLHHFGQRRA